MERKTDFKTKECAGCYLKGGFTHRYGLSHGADSSREYVHLIELMRKSDFCQAVKEEVDRAFFYLLEIPRALRDEWRLCYLEMECLPNAEAPEVAVRAELPYPHLRESGKRVYTAGELGTAVDDIIAEWMKRG